MIVAIGAEAMEFAGWLRYCTAVRKPDWPVAWARLAEWRGRSVALLAHGAGPRVAAAALRIARERAGSIDALLSIGYCGALDPALRVNDVVVPGRLRTPAGDRPLALPRGTADGGTLLSVDRFVGSAGEKAALFASGCRAVEMEAAGLADFDGPFYAFRVVSDAATESFALDFNAYRDRDGRFRKGRIALAGLAHPLDLVRMMRHGASAAQALGDFLAHCEL